MFRKNLVKGVKMIKNPSFRLKGLSAIIKSKVSLYKTLSHLSLFANSLVVGEQSVRRSTFRATSVQAHHDINNFLRPLHEYFVNETDR